MAVTAIWSVKGSVGKVLRYVANPAKTWNGQYAEAAKFHTVERILEYDADAMKTEKQFYVTGINCSDSPASVAEQFRATMTLPVLLQGETSKGQLLQQFVSAGNALLVATSSFWEGVDVRGDTLSLVIIDKLPFTSPDDPLLKARMEDCRLRGGDPFDEVQLPDAVITLKQGVGRLIRDADDRGVLVICDNRLVMRPYGATFLASLPPAPRTRDIARAVRFLAIPSSR